MSAVDCEGRSAEPHRHAYIRLKNNRARSWFHPELRDKCYLRIVQAKGGRSFDESVRRYVNYIKGKGQDFREVGTLPKEMYEKRSELRDGTCQRIAKAIQNGMKYLDCLKKWPQMTSQIARMMVLRPPRRLQTKYLYIYGPPGTGKSTVVFDVLHTLEYMNPECDFYAKMGGLCKFWDGYNNQQVVVIDDPGVFNITMTDAEANAFKNVVSHGSHTVEIKGSSFPFDSKLVVVISNVPPHQLAESAGKFHRDAIADRIMGHRSIIHQAYHVPNRAARTKFREDFCRIIVAMYNNFNVAINLENLIASIPKHSDYVVKI